MILAFTTALAVLAAQPGLEPEEGSTFTDRQPVRLQPLPAARAFAAFRDICMAAFPDPAAFDAAAAASGLGFVRPEESERGVHEWSSPHGQIVLRQAPNRERDARRDRREGHAARRRWQVRCDYWVAIEERMELPDLVEAIWQQLAPQSRPRDEILGVSWQLPSTTPDTILSLVYLPSTDDDRIFTLSLQQLPQNPG
jgi:hypothetical protein